MAKHNVRRERGSFVTLFFPLLFPVYCEVLFALFTRMEITHYKLLFALAAGSAALLLSRLIPWRPAGFILQSLFLVAYWALVAAQFIHYAARGSFLSLSAPSDAPPEMWLSAARQNWLFLLLMLPPVVLLFTLQRGCMMRRAGLAESFTGAKWMDAFGALLLFAALLLAAVVLPLRDNSGEPSSYRLMDLEFSAEDSVRRFGVLPEAALDLKYNVLGLHGEEIIHHYVVTETGQIEISPEEIPD